MLVGLARVQLCIDVEGDGGLVVGGGADDTRDAVVFGGVDRGDSEGVFKELRVGGHLEG